MPNSATFVSVDTATKGTWRSPFNPFNTPPPVTVYGADGTFLPVGSVSPAAPYNNNPSYITTFSFSGASNFTQGTNSDVRSVLSNAFADLEARWVAVDYSASSFSIDIHTTGGSHQIAIYQYDFDPLGRQTRIDIIDDADGVTVLATHTLTDYSGGVWTIWNISGNVTVKFTTLAAANSVINAIMFDPVASPPLAAGSISFSSVAQTSLTVSSSIATGGTSPYLYQFQRAPDVAGSPGSFINIGPNSSSLSFHDTGLTALTTYWYQVVVTDSASPTPATATSTAVSVKTLAPPPPPGARYVTIKRDGHVVINHNASGDNILIQYSSLNLPPGCIFRVKRFKAVPASAITITFYSGISLDGNVIGGPNAGATGVGGVECADGQFQTLPNDDLVMNLSSGVLVGGDMTYSILAPAL